MADLKISALTGATTPLAGTEVLPIVQSGATVKVSVDNLTTGKTVYAKNVDLTAGRLFLDQDYQITWRNGATNRGRIYIDSGNTIGFESGASNTTRLLIDSSGNTTVSTGNLIQGTAAKGINFTANTPAAGMTSQLLNWYEEGTWTPTVQFGGASTGITYSKQLGRYTRVGNQVTVWFDVRLTSKGSVTGDATINGLPFVVNANCNSTGIGDPITGMVGLVAGGAIILAPAATASFIYLFQQTTTSRNLMNDTNFNTTGSLGGCATYFI